MASQYFPAQVATLAGTGSTATLIAAANHTQARKNHTQARKVWKLLVANSCTGGIAATFSYTTLGTAGTLTLEVPATSTLVLPYDGAEYINGDPNTAVSVNAPTQATIQAYYT